MSRNAEMIVLTVASWYLHSLATLETASRIFAGVISEIDISR